MQNKDYTALKNHWRNFNFKLYYRLLEIKNEQLTIKKVKK